MIEWPKFIMIGLTFEFECTAILKDSEYKEVDRAECQFSTTSTVLDNGTQVELNQYMRQFRSSISACSFF